MSGKTNRFFAPVKPWGAGMPDFYDEASAIQQLIERFGAEDALPLVADRLRILHMHGKTQGIVEMTRTMGLVDKVKEAAKNG